jgi:hypothetical protein
MIKDKYKNLKDEEFVSLDPAIDEVFKGRYEINKLGWTRNIKSGVVKKSYNANIYPRISFRKGSIKKGYFVHVLLAKIFLVNDSPETKIQVDHINRNPEDYSLNNLRWVTVKKNLENRSSGSKSRQLVFRRSTRKFYRRTQI